MDGTYGTKSHSLDVPAADMDVNGLNMFEQPYGQYTVVHPMVNPPACDAPSDDVHWYTKTLGVLTTPQCHNAVKTSRFSKPKQLMLGSDRDLSGGDYFACLPCNGFLAFGPYNVHAGSMREAYGSWEGTPLAASSFQVCGNQHFDNRPFMIRKVQRMISACCHDTKLLSMWLISETWRNVSFHPRSSSKDVPIKKYSFEKKNPNAKHNII